MIKRFIADLETVKLNSNMIMTAQLGQLISCIMDSHNMITT
jgi:hypothetical protein